MKENITSKDVRFHHRICDAQKHLVQGTGNFINLSRNQGKLFEKVLEVIKDLQMSKQIEFYRLKDSKNSVITNRIILEETISFIKNTKRFSD